METSAEPEPEQWKHSSQLQVILHKWKHDYKKIILFLLIDPFKCFTLDLKRRRTSHLVCTLNYYFIIPVNVLIIVLNIWYQARLFCSSEPAQTTPTQPSPQHVHPWTIQLCFSGNKPDRTSFYLSSLLFILLFHPLTCSHPETAAWSKTDGDGETIIYKEKDSSDGSDSDLESEPELMFC